MNINDKVAVCSRSFSRNEELRSILLNKYKNITFNDQGLSLTGDSLVSFLSGHTKAIIALEVINEKIISQLSELKVISKYGVGLDMIDMKALNKYKIRLGWEGGVNKRSVSELTLSLMINCLRKISTANREIIEGGWRQHKGNQLTNKKVGIIGCGNVGKDLVKLLQPFKCKIFVNDIEDYGSFYKKYNITTLSLDNLIKKSDIITLHIPLDSTTNNILDSIRLSYMKTDAVLINTARGGLVDEATLKSMLLESKIAAAAFDVFSKEPPEDMELLKLKNFISTPHIGGSSVEAIMAMGMSAIEGLDKNFVPEIYS